MTNGARSLYYGIMQKRTLALTGLGTLLAGFALAQSSGIQAVIGNVFLQNATPGTVQAGHASIGGTFRAGQVFVQQASGATIPVVGNNVSVGAGTAIGGSFSSGQANGIGVRGTSTAPQTGAGTGVLGETRSLDGYGVIGRNVTTSSGGAPDGAGILAESMNASLPALLAKHTNGPAIVATTNAPSSTAVSGVNSGNGTGVSGFGRICVSGGGGFGSEKAGEFSTLNANGFGARGVIVPNNTAGGVGLYGYNVSPSGWAVFAEGRFGATGTKLFTIDHPADPANMTLSHYCTEGAEPLNVYSGSVRTNGRGYATVRLPAYFASINRDARVQLTVVDEADSATFVQVKVVRKVQGNTFTLRTSAPGVEVFWRIEAVRNDRWVQRHGAPVEEQKDEMMRGYYLDPSLYGLSQAQGRDAALSAYMKRQSASKPARP